MMQVSVMDNASSKVIVTAGAGFIGLHINGNQSIV
jgi:nucleoside-diphosphate-sugar epimerase